ncbi:Phosphoglycerol transferase MdoB [Methylobacterium sp. 174MFSha1.1]|uniref:sulfatase-like hydrolase/transferase n=1 Tax=Methylobacterium sp. 174MFSha1.1 TaxID=1502749 RepID=UPI0008EC4446|nr:sulfatase-like hydrolase/transferase [Methylobacterium sp. 174MFSha1.1]SFU84581.1 Phosphoglycerol transferase MdoB [Methylobacterium sp. 174MFSha1.1]
MPLRHGSAASAAALRSLRRATALVRSSVPLLVGGLVLPNALALAFGILAGVPARTSAIALYAALALLGGRLPGWALALLALPVIVLDLALAVGRMFFLDTDALLHLIDAGTLATLLATPAYAAGAAAVVGLALVYLAVLVQAGPAMRRGSRPVFAAAVAALLVGDGVVNGSTAYDFGALASVGQPFHSGSLASGFDALADQSRPPHRVLMVMVESLGVLRDAGQNGILTAPFDDPALRRLYTVTTGTSAFFGATASGEMRELCRTYRSHRQVFTQAFTQVFTGQTSAEDDPTCLPKRLAARGYRTVSVHGYHAGFYDRAQWYPLAGFRKSLFGETLAPRFARACGGPFPGPCDTDVAAVVEAELAAPGPAFVYWLTLNSHVPVPPGAATPRHDCGRPGSPFADREVCAMVEIWQDVFAAVSRIALAHPGTEILLVGDHAPPLWRRAARDAFEPGRVPWIRLAPLPVATAALP